MENKKRESKLTTLGAVLLAALAGLFVVIGVQLARFESERFSRQELEHVQQALTLLGTSLNNRMYANIHKVSSVKALVAMNPELTQDDFARAMEVQFRDEPDLRNIGLARDMILQFMYPIEGNEAAIGLDYTTLPEQVEAVELARRLNEIVIAGPLSLVQGGEGIIARIPIHVTDTASGTQAFWGFASVVMNSDSIFAGAGLDGDHANVRIAVRGRDARGPEGDVFWGDPTVFELQPVTQLIELPYGSWQMGAIPAAGWGAYAPASDPLMWIYLMVAAIILAFPALIVLLFNKTEKAVGDLERERNLFAAGPVFSLEWEPGPHGTWSLTYASSNVEHVLGYRPLEMLRPEFSYEKIIHPNDADAIINELKHSVSSNLSSIEQSYRLQTKTGAYLWVYDFTILVRKEDGSLDSIRSYLYDHSAQKQAEQALRIAEERLEKTAYELTENIPVGTYTMVQPAEGGMAHFAFMSRRFLELTGLTHEEAASDPLKAFACVHPHDFDEWVALNAKAFEERSPFFGEVRLLVNGEIRWVTAESKPRTLPDGTTVWEGVLADISDRKFAEQALNESLERFNDLVANVSVGVYVFWFRANGDMAFEWVSDGWCTMNRIRREDVLANPEVANAIIHPEDLAGFLAQNEEAVRDQSRFHWEGRIVIDGEIIFALIESTPVFFDNGESRWFGIQKDITESKKVEEELKLKSAMLEKLSLQDGLTGIPNRRHFDGRAELEWKRAVRTGLPLSLVMMDIDHFKHYNDHYGHGAGDDCLRQVAQALMESCARPLDLVARYGGEEFVTLLPETDIEGASHIAEQMRSAVAALAIPHGFSSAAAVVTISVGVCTHGSKSTKTDLRGLQQCADDALYRAKEQGRNQVQGETITVTSGD